MTKRKVYIDTEGNGLLHDITRMWCAVIKDIDTGEVFKFTPKNLDQLKDFSKEVDTWIGHNIIGYDAPVLKKLYGIDINVDKMIDTLVLSRLFNPMINVTKVDKKTGKPFTFRGQKRKQHSLDSWGETLGYPKIEFNDFSIYTQEMLDYCVNDVELGVKIYHQLLKEQNQCSEQAIRIEHWSAHYDMLQERHGFYIDYDKAMKLFQEITDRKDELRDSITKNIKPMYKLKGIKEPRFNSEGEMYKVDRRILATHKFKKVGENKYAIYKEVPFNIGSPSQIVTHMNRAGWKPTVFTKAGQPQVCEANLATLPDDAPQEYHNFTEYSMCTSRADNIRQWFDSMRGDNRVHGSIISIGAWTHRKAHRNPNTGNIAGSNSPYGREIRECWTVPEGYHLVGTDASGIQGRILAHYADDPVYTQRILEEDIHCVHQDYLGLSADPKGRSKAKTWFFSWVFGMGEEKLGQLLGGGAKEGKEANLLFESRIKGMKAFNEQIKRDWKRGYVIGLDGRQIYLPSQHKAKAAYLQGGEAAIMKLANKLWFDEATARGIDFHKVGDVHDEWQCEVNMWRAYEFGEIQVKALQDAGKMLNMKCPIDGEAIVDVNWYETH